VNPVFEIEAEMKCPTGIVLGEWHLQASSRRRGFIPASIS
jgi:hypothetical protein